MCWPVEGHQGALGTALGLLLYLITAAQGQDTVEFCEPYIEGRAICFSLHQGAASTSWEDARQACLDDNQRLLVVNSPHIRDLIRKHLTQRGLTGVGIWTALNYNTSAATWVWDTAADITGDSTQLPYRWSEWGVLSPHPDAANNNHCVTLNRADHPDSPYAFNDRQCANIFPYMCMNTLPNDYNPCLNGGVCSALDVSAMNLIEVHDGFRCACSSNIHGTYCEHNMENCLETTRTNPLTPDAGSGEMLCYWSSQATASFSDAYQSCLDSGGYLANVYDVTTRDYLNPHFASFSAGSSHWAGASCAHTSYVYRWSTGHVVNDSQVNEIFRNGVIELSSSRPWMEIDGGDQLIDATGSDSAFLCQSYNPALSQYECSEGQDCLGWRAETWTLDTQCPQVASDQLVAMADMSLVHSQQRCKDICRRRADFNCRGYRYQPGQICYHFKVDYESVDQWASCFESVTQFRNDTATFDGEVCYFPLDSQQTYAESASLCADQGAAPAQISSSGQLADVIAARESLTDDVPVYIGLKFNTDYYSVQYADSSFAEWDGDWNQPSTSLACFYMETSDNIRVTSCTAHHRIVCQSSPRAVCEGVIPQQSNTSYTYDVSTGSVEITCAEGYELSTGQPSASVPCTCGLTAAHFSGYSCDPVECSAQPHHLDNAYVVSPDIAVYSDVAAYVCDTCHYFSGDCGTVHTATCTSDGTWTNVTDACEYYPENDCCGALPVLEHGEWMTNFSGCGGHAVAMCHHGWTFPQCIIPEVITCNCSGEWSLPSIDECIEIDCGNVTNIENAKLAPGPTTYSSTTELQCDPGYQFSNGSWAVNVTCGIEGNWTEPSDTCQPASCPTPDPIFNSTKDTEELIVGTNLTYTCHLGYRFHNLSRSQTSTCVGVAYGDTRAQWQPPATFTCIEVFCPEPPEINNATAHNATWSEGEHVTYTCDTGFEFDSCVTEEYSFCTDDLDWTPVNSTCRLVDCREPTIMPNTLDMVELVPENSTLYAAEAIYTCYHNYYWDADADNNTIIRTCQADGTWSAVGVQCTHTCTNGVPPYDDATTTMDVALYLSSDRTVVNLTCVQGYHFADDTDPPLQVTCNLTSRVWQPGVIPCIEDVPTTTTEATTTMIETTMEDTTMETTRATTREMTSQATSESETTYTTTLAAESTSTSSPTTTAIYTEEPIVETTPTTTSVYTEEPIVESGVFEVCAGDIYTENARALERYNVVGGFATYACATGHSIRGYSIASVQCQSNGRWHVDRVICTPELCPDLTLDNTDCTPASHTQVGHVVRCTCHSNHVFYTGLAFMEFSCNHDQTWFPDPELVQGCLMGCPPPPLVPSSSLRLQVDGRRATYTCHPGHRFQEVGLREKTVMCTGEREWEEPGACRINICPQLPDIGNGSLSAPTAAFQGVVIATCAPGFTFSRHVHEQEVECLEDGSWNGTLSDCQAVRCEDPPLVEGAEVADSGGRFFMHNVTFTCPQQPRVTADGRVDVSRTVNGYPFETIYCNENAEWSSNPQNCEFGRCQPIPEVEHAVADTTNASEGSVVTYTCEEGYTFESAFSTSITCSDTVWHPASLQTDVLSCGFLPNYPNARLDSTAREYLATASVDCNPGYTLGATPADNHMVLQCGADAQWHVTDPDPSWSFMRQCQPVVCGGPPNIPQSSLPLSYSHAYPSELSYTCARGYWLQRGVYQYSVTCSTRATWEPAPTATTACTRITCVAFPAWDGMILNTTATLAGTAVNATCAEGYTFPDEGADMKITHCNSTGHWHPTINDCVAKPEPPFKAEPMEAENAAAVGAIGIAMVTLIVTAMVLADLQLAFTSYQAWIAMKAAEVPGAAH